MKANKKLIEALAEYRRRLLYDKFEILDILTQALELDNSYYKDRKIRKAITYIKENLK